MAQPGRQAKSVKRVLKIGIVLAVIAAAVAWGVTRQRKTVALQAERQEMGRLVSLRTGDITIKVSENGVLEPVLQVEVKSRVAGRVRSITVKEGDKVTRGQLLAEVDPTEITREFERVKAQRDASQAGLRQAQETYELNLRQNALTIKRAEAALAEARARLAATAAPNRSQDINQAQTAVVRAEAQVADARRTLERKKSLVARGFVAQSEADGAQITVTLAEDDVISAKQRLSLLREGARPVDVDSAKAAVESARVALESERTNAGQARLRVRDIERARAEVAQIENQLAQQGVQMSETRIVAPIGGEVTGKYVQTGELVASATAGFAQGATLVKIADLTRMQVKVNINEVDVARVHVGQPVEIHADGIPGKIFAGKVAAIAPSSLGDKQATSGGNGGTQGVVRFEVKITILQPDVRLRPGMTASVDIILDRHRGVPLLSAEAVTKGNHVTVVKGVGVGRTKADRVLTVGLRDDSHVEVRGGLQPDEKVEIPKVAATDRRKIDVNGPD